MERFWICRDPSVKTDRVGPASTRGLFAALLVLAVALGMVLTGVSRAPAASAGAASSAAAAPAGSGLAWGNNFLGQFGNGTNTPGSSVPVPVSLPAGTTITAIAAGNVHSLAVTSTGTVLAWGGNEDGQLGNGTNTNSNVPVAVSLPAGTTITAIAADSDYSLALTSTGTVLAWGDNLFGQLGNGTTTDSNVPVPVNLPAGTTITAIAAGFAHSLALTSTGTVLAWGVNTDGELGNGTNTNSNVPVPVSLPAGATITAIGAGNSHSLAVTSTGTVLAWGNNEFGQLGNGTNTDSNVPVAVNLPAGTTITAVAASFDDFFPPNHGYSLALTSTGTMLAWGRNHLGELGNGTTTDSNVPVPVNLPAGTTITAIAAGGGQSLALTSTGTVLWWGDNGLATASLVPFPLDLPAGTTITAIAAGGDHALAIAAEPAPAKSTSTLRVSPSNPQPNQPVTFTATVTCTAGTPTGTVTFLDGKKTLGTATLSGGPTATATLILDRLRPGSHTIRARYNGKGTCPPSTSKPVTVKVQKPQLPVTGVNAPDTLAAGTLLVLTGTALVVRNRRRPANRSNS
ncbi:Ig-like domain repeat protein [Micromonospora sp. CP22]|uniref:RCC1 domain-containing protein n=1 Tax=Micromonospora sp. CP22 TaxID=2580517 RepID=UPI0012BD3FF5|nr:Ig-like domain repeat protein [Micromonospora sp. CP22]MTK02433.1 cell wall anchor protein [Micromonospora sp. CP22]